VQLLRDPVLAGRLGQAGAAKVRAQFGWGPVAASFIRACELARSRWEHRHEHPDGQWVQAAAEGTPCVNAEQLGLS
jgi:hypothetical protein